MESNITHTETNADILPNAYDPHVQLYINEIHRK